MLPHGKDEPQGILERMGRALATMPKGYLSMRIDGHGMTAGCHPRPWDDGYPAFANGMTLAFWFGLMSQYWAAAAGVTSPR